MKSSELKRWLEAQGATFKPTSGGSHFKVFLNGKQSIIPMHHADMGTGLVQSIKKQLGIKPKK